MVVQGLSGPTDFEFLPDGRILVAEKQGVVRVVKDGVLRTTPFLDIRDHVNARGDRGLVGIAADPNFASNGYVYLHYTYEHAPARPSGRKTQRVTRVTASGDAAPVTSEVVILGKSVGPGCDSFPVGADCIPAEFTSHTGGDIQFASDGTMFVSTGDSASPNSVNDRALRAQNLDSLPGKIIRVTNTRAGLASNPFWNGNASHSRSKVWALGLRNAFRIVQRPSNGVLYIGDVGWNSWEEVNTAPIGGLNFGWPCYEGSARQPGYEPTATCQALYGQGAGAVRAPLLEYPHAKDTCCSGSVIGGAFYTGTSYPSAYQGAYFYGDSTRSWIRSLRVDSSDTLVAGSDAEFATDVDGPVAIRPGPGGDIYYLAIYTGELRRIVYGGVPPSNRAPTATTTATPTSGVAPLAVQLSSSGSSDPDGDPLTYTWSFGDGTVDSTQANPEHTYMSNGTYTARLTVGDGRGGTSTDTVTVTVGNQAPSTTITSPASALRYKVGDTISLSGSGSDPEDGAIPGSGLTWTVTLQHCPAGTCHAHPFLTTTGATGSFVVPDHGDESHFEITLTATDSTGLQGATKVAIRPQTIRLTLATSPTGLQVVYDGMPGTAPVTRTTIAGSKHTIYAPSPQGGATFVSWSDAGAQQHDVTVGTGDVTYTASFSGGGSGTQTFGQTTAGTEIGNGPNNEKAGNRHTLPQAGSVTKLSAYLDGQGAGTGAQQMRMAIYADAGGTPGALKAVSTAVTIVDGQPPGWVDFALPTPVALPAGDYWLASHQGGPTGTSNTIRRYRITGGWRACKFNADAFADGPTDPFGTPQNGNAIFSFTATYTPT